MGESSNNPSLRDKWIIDIQCQLEETSPISSSWSICKVPVKLRSVNEDAYTPHIISIGPIHHKDKKLSRMEDHKRWYLKELLKRAGEGNEILGVFYDIVLGLDELVRACYAEPIVYDEQELAKILFHDAGFILELFFRYYKPENWKKLDDPIFTTSWMITALQRDLALLENQIPFFVLESLFKLIDAAGIPTLNQRALQFFKYMLNMSDEVLHKKGSQESSHLLHLLYNCYLPIPKPGDSISDAAYAPMSFPSPLPWAGVVFEKNSTNECHTVTDSCPSPLLRAGVLFEKNSPDEWDGEYLTKVMSCPSPLSEDGVVFGNNSTNKCDREPIPMSCSSALPPAPGFLSCPSPLTKPVPLMSCPSPLPRAGDSPKKSHGAHEFEHSATSLRRAGVVFETNSTDDLFDLQFDNGTFKIPPLHIYDFTDSHFRNLIAFEQSQRGSRHYIISYMIVMDKLIDTTYDVQLLKRKGIIFNELGGEEDVSNMFNSICKEVVYKDFYFKELCIKVHAYAKSTWHRHKATLSRNYFNNPWSIISFVAAVALILLTFMQTLYSGLSYHKS